MSSPDAVTLRVHRFSLSQIGPDLEDQVAAALAQVAEAFSDPESYEGDVLKGKVTVTLDLDYHVKNRGTLARGLVAVKLPKRRAVGRALMLRPDGFLVEDEDEQLTLDTYSRASGEE